MSSLENFVQYGRKVIGAGANYHSFVKYTGRSLPTEPEIFLKAPSAYITEGNKIVIPKGFTNVNEEIELGVIIGKKCKHVSEAEAMNYVGGYCTVLDMAAICQIKPNKSWAIAKAFDTACPVSKFIPKEKIPDPNNVDLWLNVNGEQWQKDNTKNLVFNVPQLISYISKYFTLEVGDLILIGTPAGVGAVKKDDVIEAGLKGIVTIKFEVDEE
ncbi:acylpyruvase FAHD1, mitochondrial-like [Anthonomus grandis grandis]|uniref:acylpyruvase FAHD1, mitochondrial-like n=1 Tax=Anthonomus grandis grandis TaxID=2921223 RepID=UPI002166A1DE|nr:acylpyruvase FAHD1, mitochondrial-like [Anthonomus grandis grandis]